MKQLLAIPLLVILSSWVTPSADDAMLWDESRKLQWTDFKGAIDINSHADAATAVNISARPFRKGKKLFYNVEAIFIPSQSWYKSQSDQLLRHEQLHFDLAELYARRVRKKISEYRQMGVTNVRDINEAISDVLRESNEADIRYDMESLHGSLPDVQERWEKQVQTELQLYTSFSRERWK